MGGRAELGLRDRPGNPYTFRMTPLSIAQGAGILATVFAAAVFAFWRIRLGLRRERDIFLLIGGTFGILLLALIQVALLIAREGTSGH